MRTSRAYGRKNIHQQIVRELALRVLSGEVAPGDVLSPEDNAATEMDVSRTAYREAVKVLTAKGLLESRPKVGTRVRERTNWNILDPDIVSWRAETEPVRQFVRELFEFRRIIEPEAARLAADNASPEDVERILDAVQRMAETDPSTSENFEADFDFHNGILEASGNALLASLSHVVEALLLKSFELSSHRAGAREGSVPLHMAVITQIRKGNGQKARSAMTTLLESAHQDLESVLAQEGAAEETTPGRRHDQGRPNPDQDRRSRSD